MIAIIVAQARNGVIGAAGDLPWRGQLPADMAHFRELTIGHSVLMGRKTWESLPTKFRPLPGRKNIVLTREPGVLRVPKDVEVWGNFQIYGPLRSDDDLYVIGGAEIYKMFLPYAGKVHLTSVDADFDGDTFFPALDESEWNIIEQSVLHPPDDRNAFGYQFVTYERRHDGPAV